MARAYVKSLWSSAGVAPRGPQDTCVASQEGLLTTALCTRVWRLCPGTHHEVGHRGGAGGRRRGWGVLPKTNATF